MKLAMLGGSFNPVHNGHLALARSVQEQLGYDRVVLVPASISPGKKTDHVVDDKHRLNMLRLAAEPFADITVDDCELARGGVSWTIDTLLHLARLYEKELTEPVGMVIGQDLAATFDKWKDSVRIANEFTIILARRPPWDSGTFTVPHVVLDNPPIAVSSSGIRAAIQSSGEWQSLVPEPVGRYIEEHGLYAS